MLRAEGELHFLVHSFCTSRIVLRWIRRAPRISKPIVWTVHKCLIAYHWSPMSTAYDWPLCYPRKSHAKRGHFKNDASVGLWNFATVRRDATSRYVKHNFIFTENAEKTSLRTYGKMSIGNRGRSPGRGWSAADD